MDAKAALRALVGLAHESRLTIFRLLVEQGPSGMPAGRIAEALRVPAATMSFHLKELTNAGLVLARPQSRFIYYSANYEAMNALIGYLAQNCCRGEERCVSRRAAPCAPPARRATGTSITPRGSRSLKSAKRRAS